MTGGRDPALIPVAQALLLIKDDSDEVEDFLLASGVQSPV